MLEQKARKELRNALIICPISLQQKWKEELEDKFGLTFTIVESNKELIRRLQDNDGLVRVIRGWCWRGEQIAKVHDGKPQVV